MAFVNINQLEKNREIIEIQSIFSVRTEVNYLTSI